MELASDRSLMAEFKAKTLGNFWLSVRKEYPRLSAKAVDVLLPFASTYLCEAAFSKLTMIKSKLRSRLEVESELRVAVSAIAPRMDFIATGMQAHMSH